MTPNPNSIALAREATHAGGIVYRRVDREVLYALVQSNDAEPVWVWPTGHLEQGESAAEAAIREVREEAGIDARVVADLPARSFSRGGEASIVDYCLLEHQGSSVVTREARAFVWATYSDACALLTHPESVQLLEAAQSVLVDVLVSSMPASGRDWAAELLMKDYESLTKELELNESRGETRLSIYLTIATAVIAGLVSLSAAKSSAAPEFVRAVGAFGLSALLALGLVLFLRILKRDEKTDGFERDLKQAREIVRSRLDYAGLLVDWSPFRQRRTMNGNRIGQAEGSKSRAIGGLADLVAVIDSIVVAGLVLLATGVVHASVWTGLGAVFIAVISFWLHVKYRRRREKSRGV